MSKKSYPSTNIADAATAHVGLAKRIEENGLTAMRPRNQEPQNPGPIKSEFVRAINGLANGGVHGTVIKRLRDTGEK